MPTKVLPAGVSVLSENTSLSRSPFLLLPRRSLLAVALTRHTCRSTQYHESTLYTTDGLDHLPDSRTYTHQGYIRQVTGKY